MEQPLHGGVAAKPALAVYLAVRHRADLTGNATVTLPKVLVEGLGVSRDSKARALRTLEEASLVTVERQPGRTARVTLVNKGA